jgi:SNF2 family DNA or RNA helicase
METYERKIADKENIDEDLKALVKIIQEHTNAPPPPTTSTPVLTPGMSRLEQLKARSMQLAAHANHGHSNSKKIDPLLSGKMTVLYRMLQTMRLVYKQERIVIVSNYTSTLDLLQSMCQQNSWPVLRLDGTCSATKRTQLVGEFNNPHSQSFVFLLSSKAGGCGINLIGGNR